MYFKVITVVSLLTICASETPLEPRLSPHQAISSQSYVRGDVPLSYKYTAIHDYTTVKPVHQKYRPQVEDNNNYQHTRIQYAPLLKPGNHLTNMLFTQNNVQNNQDEQNTHPTEGLKKDHLEPKIIVTPKPEKLSYIPGHNIEVLQSMNRSPGHNAVYRSYHENADYEKTNKVNYLGPYLVYQKPGQQLISITTQNLNQEENVMTTETPEYDLVSRQYYRAQPNSFEVASSIENSHQNFAKPNRLHLNTARTYNFAHVPVKAPLNSEVKSVFFETIPSHTQAFVKVPHMANLQAVASEQKTYLYPIQNKYRIQTNQRSA